MKERPILFSGPMVRATLDGRKEQTRRVIKPQPFFNQAGYLAWKTSGCLQNMGRSAETMLATHCPYGQPGDRLWVKETIDAEMYASRTWNGLTYRADGVEVIADHPPGWTPPLKTIKTHRESGDNIPGGGFDWYTGTVPSIFMPRWASRITLEITGIRVERLQDISMEDAISEGVDWKRCPTYQTIESFTEQRLAQKLGMACFPILTIDYIGGYKKLWESINGPGSWDKNPHVWVVEFRRVK